jgi:hypothetical protein
VRTIRQPHSSSVMPPRTVIKMSVPVIADILGARRAGLADQIA